MNQQLALVNNNKLPVRCCDAEKVNFVARNDQKGRIRKHFLIRRSGIVGNQFGLDETVKFFGVVTEQKHFTVEPQPMIDLRKVGIGIGKERSRRLEFWCRRFIAPTATLAATVRTR